MVLQDTSLFTGTVKENIRYGKLDATEEEIKSVPPLVPPAKRQRHTEIPFTIPPKTAHKRTSSVTVSPGIKSVARAETIIIKQARTLHSRCQAQEPFGWHTNHQGWFCFAPGDVSRLYRKSVQGKGWRNTYSIH